MAEIFSYEVEMVKPKDVSTSEKMIASSYQICSTEQLDITVEDAKNKKKTLESTMDSVISLLREVEHREKVAEQAVAVADMFNLEILAKVDELKQAHQLAKETNQTHAKGIYAKRYTLGTEIDVLQLSIANLLNEGDRTLVVLDEISRALVIRLSSAITKKQEADKEKLKKEESALEALAFEERQMEMTLEESKRLNREEVENSKLHEFVFHRGQLVEMFRTAITGKIRDVKLLKEELDRAIPL